MYSPPIEQLINLFKRLPSVGERTAERFVFYLLKSGKKEAGQLGVALHGLIKNVKSCEVCWDFSDQSPCKYCSDSNRNNKIICIVTESQDIPVIERTGEYTGLYHVLRGTIKPDDENSLKFLKIKELFARINVGSVVEIILALNPDIRGDLSMMMLQKEIKKRYPQIKITRLARGLPMGSDLQYADEITLGSAIKNRL